jgi:hypothetical protein
MFGLLFSVLVIIGLLSNAFHIAMRIRLLRMDAARDRIEWLSFRASTEVMDTYQAFSPRSVLPRLSIRFLEFHLLRRRHAVRDRTEIQIVPDLRVDLEHDWR